MTSSDLVPVAVLIVGAVALTLALYRVTWVSKLEIAIAKEEAKYWQERYLESERFRDELTQDTLKRGASFYTEVGPNGNKLDS